MLKTSWSLLYDGPRATRLSTGVQREIGWWRAASDLWLTTQRPAESTLASADNHLPLPTTSEGVPDLQVMADALRRPVPGISPFQQSLRHAVLSAVEDEADVSTFDAILSTQARAAEIDLAVVETALQALWQAVAIARAAGA